MSDKTPNHSWNVQELLGLVGLSIWNCQGYSITFQFTPSQARAIARELIAQAEEMPRVGTPADLGCEVL